MSRYGFRNNKLNIKELEFPGKIMVHDIIPNTAAVSSVGITNAWDVSAGVSTAALTNDDFTAQPPYPLCIQVYAAVAGTADNSDKVNITGYTAKGDLITEGVAVASTIGGSFYSNNAFTKITGMAPDDSAHKSTDVNIGWANEIGLSYDLEKETDILGYSYDGAYSTANAGLTFTVNTTYDTVLMPTMVDAKTLKISYLSKVKSKSQ